jgi:tripartite-type tricarboxylate transporter receptor subunit TctC
MEMNVGKAVLAIALGLSAFAAIAADPYPTRPIRLINPFAPGGSADLAGRVVAEGISQRVGQPVIVENKPGAGATIGSDFVAKSPADGYTLLLSNFSSQVIAVALYKKLPYDSMRDFAHIGMIGAVPNILLVHSEFPARTVQEFIAYAKAKPGSINYASGGIGSSGHLSSELLKSTAGIDLVHVPFKGGGPALQSTLAGQTQAMFENAPTAVAQVRSGRVRPLGVAAAKRIPQLPDTPTFVEAGFPNFIVGTWMGLSAPAGTPDPVITKLNAALREVLASPQATAKLAELAWNILPMTPEEYAAQMAKDIAIWTPIVKASGATAD